MGSSFSPSKYKPKLSFSTLGCPDWTLRQSIDFASKHGFSGLELRGIGKEMDLTKCEEFATVEARSRSMKWMKENNLSFSDLGSSCNLHIQDKLERMNNIDEGKRYIDLAAQIQCPHIRVFPNNLPKDQEKSRTIDLISEGLHELARHAEGSKVTVLMETHGDLIWADDILKVMQQATHPHAALVWDIVNMWIETQEPSEDVYRKLKPYIRHTHIKDARKRDGKITYLFLGQGETPVMQSVDILAKDGYDGFFSFEWEKRWHPEIAEPEFAFADYAKVMKEHFR